MIAANKSYDIHLTGNPPSQLRFRILNADSSFKAKISMYYFTSQRIDVYKDDIFQNATNALYLNGKMTIQDPSSNIASYMPSYSNVSGTNLYYKVDQRMHFTLDGSGYIDLKIAPVLFVRFGVPAITPAQFFNPATLVGNFALLLGVDASKIRKVTIVKASGKKKRQSDSLIFVELTIFDDPPKSSTNNNASNDIQSQLSALNKKISNQYLTGELQAQAQSIMNVSLQAMSIKAPITNSTQAATSQEVSLVKVAKIVVVQNADQCKSMLPCAVQPSIKVLDENVNYFKI